MSATNSAYSTTAVSNQPWIVQTDFFVRGNYALFGFFLVSNDGLDLFANLLCMLRTEHFPLEENRGSGTATVQIHAMSQIRNLLFSKLQDSMVAPFRADSELVPERSPESVAAIPVR